MFRIKFLAAITCMMQLYSLTALTRDDMNRVWDALPASSLAKQKCEENKRAWLPIISKRAHCLHLNAMLAAFEEDMNRIKGKENKAMYLRHNVGLMQSKATIAAIFGGLGILGDEAETEHLLLVKYQVEMTKKAIEKEIAEADLTPIEKQKKRC